MQFFIKAEKELQKKLGHKPQNQNDLLGIVLKLVENQQRQTDVMMDFMSDMKNQTQIPLELEKVSMSQRKKIRELITKKVNRVSVKTGMDRQTIAPGIYIAFKNEFNLDEYGELPATLYDEAMLWLEEYEPFTKYRDIAKKYPFCGNKVRGV